MAKPEKTLEKNAEAPMLITNELFKSRTVTFFGEMKPEVSEAIAKQLLALASVSDDPIKLYINSPGGHVESGDTIHDLISFLNLRLFVLVRVMSQVSLLIFFWHLSLRTVCAYLIHDFYFINLAAAWWSSN